MGDSKSAVRVRFAPSPTGFLHIGGARTALFNWLFAHRQGGTFILRIEDTDRQRSEQRFVEEILDSMQWLGMNWDEGPFFQSQRTELYERCARQLLDAGKAYESEGATYFKVPMEVVEFDDIIHGKISVDNRLSKDLVMMKSDGSPTYSFACVVDDNDMGITHVIRGDDHISNTPRQVALYQAFGWTTPAFAHIPMIHGADRARLSKRTGAKAISEFRDEGYLPEALFNFLALMGWSPGNNEEVLSRDELVKRFELGRVNKTAAIFDLDKLNWLNGQHLRARDPKVVLEDVLPKLREKGIVGDTFDRSRLLEIITVLLSRAYDLEQLANSVGWFFTDKIVYDSDAEKKLRKSERAPQAFELLIARLEALPAFDQAAIETTVRGVIDDLGVKGGDVIHPIRAAISGATVGPGLFELMEVFGKDTCVRRLRDAVEYLQSSPSTAA